MTEDSLRCSPGELLAIFREALIALTPTADRLLLEWGDGSQHRDWEKLAATLFDVCVRGPIESDSARREREFPLPRYDIDVDSYTGLSWISVASEQTSAPAVLIRLVTDWGPFDTLQVAILDPSTLAPIERALVPLANATVSYVRRSEAQPDVEIRQIEAVD